MGRMMTGNYAIDNVFNALDNQIASLQQQLSRANRYASELESQIASLERDVSDADEVKKAWEERDQQWFAIRDKLSTEKKSAIASYNEAIQQKAALIEKYNTLVAKHNGLQTDLTAQKKANAHLQQSIDNLSQELNEGKEKIQWFEELTTIARPYGESVQEYAELFKSAVVSVLQANRPTKQKVLEALTLDSNIKTAGLDTEFNDFGPTDGALSDKLKSMPAEARAVVFSIATAVVEWHLKLKHDAAYYINDILTAASTGADLQSIMTPERTERMKGWMQAYRENVANNGLRNSQYSRRLSFKDYPPAMAAYVEKRAVELFTNGVYDSPAKKGSSLPSKLTPTADGRPLDVFLGIDEELLKRYSQGPDLAAKWDAGSEELRDEYFRLLKEGSGAGSYSAIVAATYPNQTGNPKKGVHVTAPAEEINYTISKILKPTSDR